MIYRLSDNIISPLGFTTVENFDSVVKGVRGMKYHETIFGLPEACTVSLIDNQLIDDRFKAVGGSAERYTKLEKLAILSIHDAISKTDIDVKDEKTIFIFSTTKGNIELLDNHDNTFEKERIYLWRSAELTAQFFGNKNKVKTVSNACISGACAQILAKHILESGHFETAIVVGADVLSKFIISGFQSFKALSIDPCKPFDENRAGLNLGEAAATIIYSVKKPKAINFVALEEGAICNDANHISGPSRTGEGSFLSLQKVMKNSSADEISFVNAHGTATPYNDEMESIAIQRAGLIDVPVNSLKGYFGHTLGAAGVLESILSIHALFNKKILKSIGFEKQGVSYPIKVTTDNLNSEKKKAIKLLSGFGGCNAAILFKKE